VRIDKINEKIAILQGIKKDRYKVLRAGRKEARSLLKAIEEMNNLEYHNPEDKIAVLKHNLDGQMNENTSDYGLILEANEDLKYWKKLLKKCSRN
jgi:hypothetical protein